ncbi:MAG: DNA cytosine methyltransferase, partial [Candidatus Thorarchaeota archaeon]
MTIAALGKKSKPSDTVTLYNHVTSNLSTLDLEMILNVPPGGNWKDIPLEIAKKSVRLMQIRESGGRTTYYGRLRNDLPSYTISTYFNRPGNGTFIHPTQHRLISFREAARLQSFPDHYRFLGSNSSKLKQIGNAVPPLLAL